MQLSKNFSLRELTQSQHAARHGIDNTPPPEVVENLRALCTAVLQPLREAIGKSITITSGYRSPEVNKAIGGSTTGQHPKGEAADFECFSMDNKALAQKIIDMKLPFDQLILEFYVSGDPNSGWVHVSHRRDGKNRGQVLTASRGPDGKTKYTPGLG